MKILIKRLFSAKVQIRQFEPIDSFCGAETEIETTDYNGLPETKGLAEKEMEGASRFLDDFCRKEVEFTLSKELQKKKDEEDICQFCHGKSVYGGEKVINGMHPACKKVAEFKKKDL